MSQKILILGVNGFIGSHLAETILEQTNWEIRALDLNDFHVQKLLENDRFTFHKADMREAHTWVEESIEWADILLPLVAIANPALYVKEPLKVFELDFEANLPLVRLCVKHKTHLVFPSTSEVYGMCDDPRFDEENSHFILGPIHKQRWIYSCSKQLLDRVIYAYGVENKLSFTLFRPFNWIGPRLDSLDHGQTDRARALTRFISDTIRRQRIDLVDGGSQRRCFLDVRDGIQGLLSILKNHKDKAHNRIFNLGNPENNHSVRELAESLLRLMKNHPTYQAVAHQTHLMDVPAQEHYGEGYQDVTHRVPAIEKAAKYLDWTPSRTLDESLAFILEDCAPQVEAILAELSQKSIAS